MSAVDRGVVWKDGHGALREHPAFGPLVERIGPVTVSLSEEAPFEYLVRGIVYQQLAGAAARTIHGRVLEALGGDVTPARVQGTGDDALRGAGLSRPKLAAIRDLSSRAGSGEVDLTLEALQSLDDEEVVSHLTRVRGIGPWTAQMFLMFRLHRPDVWPTLDLGVRSGWARIFGLDEAPSAKELHPLGEEFRPWRSAAAWYCWRALEIELPEGA
jgi:DNA-3-methyladenine glycosylase II